MPVLFFRSTVDRRPSASGPAASGRRPRRRSSRSRRDRAGRTKSPSPARAPPTNLACGRGLRERPRLSTGGREDRLRVARAGQSRRARVVEVMNATRPPETSRGRLSSRIRRLSCWPAYALTPVPSLFTAKSARDGALSVPGCAETKRILRPSAPSGRPRTPLERQTPHGPWSTAPERGRTRRKPAVFRHSHRGDEDERAVREHRRRRGAQPARHALGGCPRERPRRPARRPGARRPEKKTRGVGRNTGSPAASRPRTGRAAARSGAAETRGRPGSRPVEGVDEAGSRRRTGLPPAGTSQTTSPVVGRAEDRDPQPPPPARRRREGPGQAGTWAQAPRASPLPPSRRPSGFADLQDLPGLHRSSFWRCPLARGSRWRPPSWPSRARSGGAGLPGTVARGAARLGDDHLPPP